jgi:hypothetical protein
VQAAGDHQVDDQEEIVLERDHQALADAPQPGDALAADGAQRGIDGAQQEGREQTHALERGGPGCAARALPR